MQGRLRSLVAAAVLLAGLGVGSIVVLDRAGAESEPLLCPVPELFAGSADFITHGDVALLANQHHGLRDICPGNDLWVFAPQDIVQVDGVLFDDCVIAWTEGGRSSAEAEGVPCEPISGAP
jgi:hypothetical protein